MPAKPYLLLASILCLPSLSSHAELKNETGNDQISEELLEFLGQWEKVDGEWMDPTQLQEISMLDKKGIKGDTDDQ